MQQAGSAQLRKQAVICGGIAGSRCRLGPIWCSKEDTAPYQGASRHMCARGATGVRAHRIQGYLLCKIVNEDDADR